MNEEVKRRLLLRPGRRPARPFSTTSAAVSARALDLLLPPPVPCPHAPLTQTPVYERSRLVLPPHSATPQLALTCVLQARITCVRACTAAFQSCLRSPLALT